MTKSVRIENADTAPYKVVVEVQEKRGEEWVTVDTEVLHNPAQLALKTLWSGRRIIVTETDSTSNT